MFSFLNISCGSDKEFDKFEEALKANDLVTMKKMLDDGMNPNRTRIYPDNSACNDSKDHYSMFVHACLSGTDEAIQLLLDYGADPTLLDPVTDATAIYSILCTEKVSRYKWAWKFIEMGTPVDKLYDPNPYLTIQTLDGELTKVCKKGENDTEEIVQEGIKLFDYIYANSKVYPYRIFWDIIASGNIVALKHILENYDFNSTNSDIEYVITYAAKCNEYEICEYLLELGKFDPNAAHGYSQDDYMNAYEWALERQYMDIYELLMSYKDKE